MAVEGRFCDSAISVREAALELVGRHIASHPDVGLQVVQIERTYPCILRRCFTDSIHLFLSMVLL